MQNRTFTLIGAMLLLFVVAFAINSFAKLTDANPTTPRLANDAKSKDGEDSIVRDPWEYLIVQGGTVNLNPTGNASMRKEPGSPFAREHFPLEQNLDKLGMKGWELVAVTGSPADPIYYFKRRK
ncbi:MAG: hypothetical protein HY231_15060 [Acidobacteria bacterium]|nr:hypothetical protein [Acidobacteriota bacterium]